MELTENKCAVTNEREPIDILLLQSKENTNDFVLGDFEGNAEHWKCSCGNNVPVSVGIIASVSVIVGPEHCLLARKPQQRNKKKTVENGVEHRSHRNPYSSLFGR